MGALNGESTMKQYRNEMTSWDFHNHEKQFSDDYLTHCYHQWAWTNDPWAEWMETFNMGGEI